VLASLADGQSTLTGALDSEDTRVMIEGLRQLGFRVMPDLARGEIHVEGQGGRIPNRRATLHLENSGTSLRFLTALAGLGHGTYHLDGTARMRERPVLDLLRALGNLGVEATSDHANGCPPVTVRSAGLLGGITVVRGDVSSQFLSALLMVLPAARERSVIELDGPLVSQPYIDMTLKVMQAFGVQISSRQGRWFHVEPARYHARKYAIEPDASAASYFFASAAITGGSVTVEGLDERSIQGDFAFVDLLEHMGCQVERAAGSTTVRGPRSGGLRGIDVDMNAISDTVMTLAAVALFARGMTRIRNIGHIRHKETDRIAALAHELRALGAGVQEYPDGLVIDPPEKIQPAQIATYKDHRMAMSMALVGLAAPGVVILDPGCVGKTYPDYWEDLEKLRAVR
jgi:3-phosphoshikimate 1-carboxyvinyltransferase